MEHSHNGLYPVIVVRPAAIFAFIKILYALLTASCLLFIAFDHSIKLRLP